MEFISKVLNLYRKNSRSKKILFWGALASLILSLVLNYQLSENIKIKNIGQLKKIEDDLNLNFEIYSHPLEGIRSQFFYDNLKINHKAFRRASESRDLYYNFKGALGFGFIRKVEKENIKEYLINQKKDRPDFSLKYLKKLNTPSDSINVIEFIEPIEKNIKAIGLVVSDEEHRLEAANKSMKTGKPTITEAIVLVQDEKKTPGFLYFLPIYNTPYKPKAEKERVEKIIGWAYAPILASEVVNLS